jgi:transcriptional regulator with XRE-family HTH domain
MPAKPVFSKAQFDVLYDAARKARRKYKNQTDFALALGITQPSASALLDRKWKPGVKTARHIAEAVGQTLEELVGDFEEIVTSAPRRIPDTRYPNLEVCVQFHEGRKAWAAWTLAAARAGVFGPTDYVAPEWAAKLDALDETLRKFQKIAGAA